MADKDYKINIDTSKSGDGAEQTEEAIKKVGLSTQQAGKDAEDTLAKIRELNEASGAASADGRYAEAEKLRVSAKELEEIYKNQKAIQEQQLASLREHKTLADAQLDVEKQKTAEIQKQAEVDAEFYKDRSKPRAKITQVDDSTIGKYKGAGNKVDRFRAKVSKLGKTLKKNNPKLLKMGKMLGRAGLVYKGITLIGGVVAKGTDKIAAYGDEMKSFGDDMELTGSKGAGLVQWLGKVGQSFKGVGDKMRIGLSPFSSWIDATKKLAAAQRELAKVEKKAARELAQMRKEREKANKVFREAAETQRSYNESQERTAKREKMISDFLRDGNRALEKRAKLIDAIADRKLAEINADKEEKLDAVDDEDPKAEQKKFAINQEAEAKKESVRQARFRESQKKKKAEINLTKQDHKDAANEVRKLKGLGQGKFGNKVIGEGALNELKAEKQGLINKKAFEHGLSDAEQAKLDKLKEKIPRIEKLIKNLESAGIDGGAAGFFTAMAKAKERVEALDEKLKDQREGLVDNFRGESNRRFTQRKDTENSQRDFKTSENKRTKKKGEVLKNELDSETEKAGGTVGSALETLGGVPGLKSKFKDRVTAAQSANTNGTDSEEMKAVIEMLEKVLKSAESRGNLDSGVLSALQSQKARLQAQDAKVKAVDAELKKFQQLYKNNRTN